MRIVLALLLAGCAGAEAHAAPQKSDDDIVAVRLAPVERGPVAHPVRGTGLLRLKREMDLSFKVGGVVASVLVDDGATVKRGQVLARLDPTEVDAALRRARESSVKAQRDLERTRTLHATGALATVELQNAETGFALAEAVRDAAAFDAQRSTILAPDDGRVDHRLVEAGEVVAPGKPIFHMSGRSKGAVVRMGVSDRDVLRIHEGDPAKVVLDAQRRSILPAHVTQVATVATSGTGTFDVEVKLDPTDVASLSPSLSGLTAKVEIGLVESNVGATIPIGAAIFGPNGATSVGVVGVEGRVRVVGVDVAFVDGGRVVLTPGQLDGVERVVEDGAGRIKDGATVRVVP